MALLTEVNVGVEITLNAFLKGLEIELMMQTDKKFGDGSLVCKQENFLLSDGGSKKICSCSTFQLTQFSRENILKGEKSQKLDKFSHVVFCDVLKPNFLPILYRPALWLPNSLLLHIR